MDHVNYAWRKTMLTALIPMKDNKLKLISYSICGKKPNVCLACLKGNLRCPSIQVWLREV